MPETVPEQDFTVPTDWVRDMIRVADPGPRVLGKVLDEAGLHWPQLSEPGAFIPQRSEVSFLHELVHQVGDSYFAADLGLRTSGRTSTLVSYIQHSSRTLGEAMTNSARLLPLTRPGVVMETQIAEGGGAWILDNLDPWVTDSALFQEFATSVIIASFRISTGQPVRPLDVTLRRCSHGRTPRLAHMWGCPVKADGDSHVVRFSDASINLPLVAFDAPLLSHLQSYGKMLLANRPDRTPDLRLQLHRSVVAHLSRGAPPVAEVAADLGLSVRTLGRRLAEMGLTYRGVIEEVRREKAEMMLTADNLTLAEITFMLGYSDQSSFTNAFRRWTGQAPGAYRAARKAYRA